MAVVCVLRSLARFVATYLSGQSDTVPVHSVSRPIMMPRLCSIDNNNDVNEESTFTASLSRETLKRAIHAQKCAWLFTADKTLELLACTGLFEEALAFLRAVNDWKSSFLVGAMLKESEQMGGGLGELSEAECAQALALKVCALLGVDKMELDRDASVVDKKTESVYSKLMEKSQVDSVTPVLKELLLCSVRYMKQ